MLGNKVVENWNVPAPPVHLTDASPTMTDLGPKLMRGLLEAFILERLEAEPQHGYALLKEMEDRFGVAPNRNKIYPLLQRFEDDGLIRRVDDGEDSRGRTMYELTEDGREALDAYRRVPRPFRESVMRLWPTPPTTERAAPAPPTPPAAAAPAADDAPTPAGAAPPPAPVRIPVAAAAAGTIPKPYPCSTARVDLAKDPRTGDINVRLVGCPMGAYEYCPQCPIYEAVGGLRKLLFG